MSGTSSAAAIPKSDRLTAADQDVIAAFTMHHEKVGHQGEGLWHNKRMQLPAYIQHIANDLIHERGFTMSHAIATAVSRCKVWCAGGDNVKADTRAKACAAIAEWEALKVKTHLKPNEHDRHPGGDHRGSADDVDAVGPKGYEHGWIKVGTHVRVKDGYHGGREGHIVQLPGNTGAVVKPTDGKSGNLSTARNELEPTGKPDMPGPGIDGPSAPKFAPKIGDTVLVGGREGKIRKLGRYNGIDSALVEYPISEHANRYQGEGYAPHWEPLTSVRRPKQKASVAAAAGLPELVTMPGVDLVAAGTWELSSGRNTFTRDDLQSAIDAANCPAVGAPVIKLGHVDPRFDGEPAIGRVTNMRMDATGSKLVGDLVDMPGWFGSIAKAAYPRRSVEGSYGFTCQIGHKHPFVLTGLAMLGVSAPGVGVLNGLPDIASLYGIEAASPGETFRTAPLDMEGAVVAVTEEDVRREYYANGGAPASWWITELQMAPTQLVVAGEDGKLYRVPFQIEGDDGAISFGDAEEVPDYAALSASRGTGHVITYASAAASKTFYDDGTEDADDVDDADTEDDGGDDVDAADNKPYGDVKYADPKNGKYPINSKERALAAWRYINQKENADKYPMNGVTLESVKSRIAAACKKFGIDISAGTGDSNRPGEHGKHTGTHSHPHNAYGAQEGDEAHSHSHSHKGDDVHKHAHANASADKEKKGGSIVEFTDEQEASLRASLGLGEEDELTPDAVLTASAALRESADKKVAAAKRSLPPGVIQVSQEVWDNLNNKVEASARFQAKVMRNERDEVIDKAIRDGKFTAASRNVWVRQWDIDPDAARDTLATLKKNVVPVSDVGQGGGNLDDESYEAEYASLYPPGTAGFGAGR